MKIRSLQFMLSVLLIFTSLTAIAAEEMPEVTVPRFEVRSYKVEGNTLIPIGDLDSILLPFTGKERDFGTVQEALDALEQA